MKWLVQAAITMFNAVFSIIGYFDGVDLPNMERVIVEATNCLKKHTEDFDFKNNLDESDDDTWKIPKNNLHTFRNGLSAIKDDLKIPGNSTTYFPWSFWKEISEKAIIADNVVDAIEYYNDMINNTFSKKCPPPYFNFGGGCIVILSSKKVTWVEARDACETHNGTLFTFRKKMHYNSLRSYLRNIGITFFTLSVRREIRESDNLNDDDKHFWIGGHINSDGLLGSSKWTWIDNTDMEMKSPVWGVYMKESCNATNKCNYNFYFASASQETRKGDCLAMDYDFDFFFSDQSCLEKRYPVCLLKKD